MERVVIGLESENTYHETESNDTDHRVYSNDWAPNVILIADPCSYIHVEASHEIRGSNEALGRCKRKPHAVAKNQWQEVRNTISNGSEAAITSSETLSPQVVHFTYKNARP